MDNEGINKLAEDIKESGGEVWTLLFIMALFGFYESLEGAGIFSKEEIEKFKIQG